MSVPFRTKLESIEVQKYMRQIIVPNVRADGQIKFRNARVLIIGLGGLGSPVLMYLASSGCGKIGVMDYDQVEMHNLQRQVIYNEKMIGKSKAIQAAEFARNLNKNINVVVHDGFINEECISQTFKNYDVIADCTDNIHARYLISDYCRINKKILVAASVLKWEGQIFVLNEEGPCYRCLLPEVKEYTQNCDEAGIISACCGIIGSIQAAEIMKAILGQSKSQLIVVDALNSEYNVFTPSRKRTCKVCTDKKIPDTPVMQSAPKRLEKVTNKITWQDYAENAKDYFLVDVRAPIWFEICSIEGSINIPGTEIEQNIEMLKKKNKKIALLCNKGISAGRSANALEKAGVTSYVIEGGLKKYKKILEPSFPLEID